MYRRSLLMLCDTPWLELFPLLSSVRALAVLIAKSASLNLAPIYYANAKIAYECLIGQNTLTDSHTSPA